MSSDTLQDRQWTELSEFIARTLGLHFPPNRWADLQRGVACATSELGFMDATACVEWISSARLTQPQLRMLASHLTVGETYFFREKRTFEVLADSVLPELIFSRRNRDQRLRIWSAACSTGEEAYSLAIMLHQVIPDLADWRATILATDINDTFLKRAVAGIYGEWSFRGTPESFKERYFTSTEDGRYSVLPEIKKIVTFAALNLVEDPFPSLAASTNAIDVVFCRNVLMYFTPPQAQKVVNKLHRALADGGWLVLSPSECSQSFASGFTQVNFPGAILYQKREGKDGAFRNEPLFPIQNSGSVAFNSPLLKASQLRVDLDASESMEPSTAASAGQVDQVAAPRSPRDEAATLFERGQYADAAEILQGILDSVTAPASDSFSLLARALANQGKLDDSLQWCDRWVATDKLDSSSHYLRAVVLQELGDIAEAQRSLQRAIYLDPQFVLAHFSLGNLARGCGKLSEAKRYFNNASRLLGAFQPDELLPESDGLTASRLAEIIKSIIDMEAAP